MRSPTASWPFLVAAALASACGDGSTFEPADDDVATEDDDSVPGDDDTGPQGAAPVADAGGSLWVEVGQTAVLDGSASYDPDARPLTYDWSLLSAPAGSAAGIVGSTSVQAALVPDVEGTYSVELLVDDGTQTATDSAHVNATAGGGGDDDDDDVPNTPPVADAGSDRSTTEGQEVTLDGSGSFDHDGDNLAYSWSAVAWPIDPPNLSGADGPYPRFTPEDPGTYVVQLIVNDGYVNSPPDQVTVTVEEGSSGDDGCGCFATSRISGPDPLPGSVQLDTAGPGRSGPAGRAALASLAALAVALRRTRR
ncbi:PKD domain-containing protein [Myxococcota bacterium]|nr:PKD domain-containing protein [Myxococcota bacterium]